MPHLSKLKYSRKVYNGYGYIGGQGVCIMPADRSVMLNNIYLVNVHLSCLSIFEVVKVAIWCLLT